MDIPCEYSRNRYRGPGERQKSCDFHWTTTLDTPPTGWYSYLLYQRGDSEEIRDTPHSRTHGATGWKFPPGQVYHDVWDTRLLRSMYGRWYTDVNRGNYFDCYDTTVFPPFTTDAVNSITPTISDADFYSLTREAFNYFSDAFPPQMSFSEFIVGMRDVAELLPQIQESMAKSFSGGYLNKEFGWDNLISDLNTLGNLFQLASDRLSYLKEIYGKPTRWGFFRGMHDPLTVANGSYVTLNTLPWSGGSITITLRTARADFRATASILQTLDYLNGTVGLIRSLVGALGLNNPVKAFWVNCPFSFVVDWFFHISDHLDTLTRLNPSTGWSVLNPTCSIKQYAVFDVSYEDVDPSRGLDDHRQLGSFRRDTYRRFVGLPLSLADLLPTSELSPTQLTLLLALLHQQG